MLHPWHQSNCSLPSTELDKSIAGTRPLPKCCGTPQWGGGAGLQQSKIGQWDGEQQPPVVVFSPSDWCEEAFFFRPQTCQNAPFAFQGFFLGEQIWHNKMRGKKTLFPHRREVPEEGLFSRCTPGGFHFGLFCASASPSGPSLGVLTQTTSPEPTACPATSWCSRCASRWSCCSNSW